MPPGDGAGGSILTYRIPRWRIALGRYSPYAVVVLFGVIAVQGYFAWRQGGEVGALRDKNVALQSEIEAIDEQVDGLARMIQRVQRFDARLRKATMLSDPERNLAMGPVGAPESSASAAVGARSSADLKRDLLGEDGTGRATRLITERVELLGETADSSERSVRSLELYLEDQQSLLASTPSLNPTRGWRTSAFGFRTDPYTGLSQMHAGVDIATDHGKEVIAPGDGLVTFAGKQGAYGNVVILDHGNGLTSLYAHLSEFHVKVGEQVHRGNPIAKVGNTGRSTGPHLHYEIRINGVPRNPDRFILE